MERLILDTSVLVQAERSGRSIDDLADQAADVVIAAVTAAELWLGVELAGNRDRDARRASVEATIERLTVAPYDLSVARDHARLLEHARRTGRPRGAHDLIVAATALAQNRTVVTFDTRGFDDLPGVEVRAPA